MDNKLVEVTLTDLYVLLTLNQPETYNAFSKPMIEMLTHEISMLNSATEPKPLVITGKGKAFSSGGNLEVMYDYVKQEKGKQYIESIVPYVNKLIQTILAYNGPTLAILNGSAVGGGFNLAMACDFRIAHEQGKFRLGFIDIGLTPATGNSFFISKVIGIPRTMSLSLFSEVISAKNLVDWGLVNEMYTEDTFEITKNKWLDKICSLDPWQVNTVRKLLYAGMTNSSDQQLALEYESILQAGSRELFKEKVFSRWNDLTSRKTKSNNS